MRFKSGQGNISAPTTGQFFSARFVRRLFVAYFEICGITFVCL